MKLITTCHRSPKIVWPGYSLASAIRANYPGNHRTFYHPSAVEFLQWEFPFNFCPRDNLGNHVTRIGKPITITVLNTIVHCGLHTSLSILFTHFILVKNDAANRDKYGELIHIENRTVSPDPEPILNYLDLLATLKGLSNVAGDFQKSLKKQNMPNIEDQAQVQKYWKAMALPRVDLSNIQPKVTTP